MPFTAQLNRLRMSLNKRKHLNLSATLTTFPISENQMKSSCTLQMNPIKLVQGFIRIGMLSDPNPSIIDETQIIWLEAHSNMPHITQELSIFFLSLITLQKQLLITEWDTETRSMPHGTRYSRCSSSVLRHQKHQTISNLVLQSRIRLKYLLFKEWLDQATATLIQHQFQPLPPWVIKPPQKFNYKLLVAYTFAPPPCFILQLLIWIGEFSGSS